MGLNFTAPTNFDTFLDFNERTNESVITNLTFIEITRLNNNYIRPTFNITNPDFFYNWFSHIYFNLLCE